MQNKAINIFLIFYPILPVYFRIAGIPSYKILTVLCFALYILGYHTRVKIKKRDFIAILIITGLWLLINVVHKSLNGIVNTILDYLLIFFMLLTYFNSRERIERGLNALLNASIVMSLFGFFEFLTSTSLFTYIYSGNATDSKPDLQMRGIFARSEASFGHAIPFAIYLSLNALIALYFYYETGKKKYLYMFFVLTVAIFTTISRAPILVFILGVALFFVLLGMEKLIINMGKAVILALVVVVISYFAFPAVYQGISFIWNVTLSVFSENALKRAGQFQNANPFEYRLALYSISRQLIEGKVWFGTGNAIDYFTWGNNPYGSNLHYSIDNAYLYWLVRYGVIGLITNILPLLACFLISIKNKKKDKLYVLFFVLFVIITVNYFTVASLSESKICFILYAMCWALPKIKVLATKNNNNHATDQTSIMSSV